MGGVLPLEILLGSVDEAEEAGFLFFERKCVRTRDQKLVSNQAIKIGRKYSKNYLVIFGIRGKGYAGGFSLLGFGDLV